MRVIRRYLFRAIAAATGLVMSVLMGLAVFIEKPCGHGDGVLLAEVCDPGLAGV